MCIRDRIKSRPKYWNAAFCIIGDNEWLTGLPINAIKDVLLEIMFRIFFLKNNDLFGNHTSYSSNNNGVDERLWRILNMRIYPWVRL